MLDSSAMGESVLWVFGVLGAKEVLGLKKKCGGGW